MPLVEAVGRGARIEHTLARAHIAQHHLEEREEASLIIFHLINFI